MNGSIKILMVCTGNICRSPMAEGLYKHLIKDKPLNYDIDSAGIEGYHIGQKPDPRAIKTMGKHGIDISRQRARMLNSNDLNDFDYILVATDQHLTAVQALTTDHHQAKIEKMLKTHPEKPNQDLSDPYYGQSSDFEEVYEELLQAFKLRINHE